MTDKVTLPRERIREVFLRNGFTVKPGQEDLKEYIYVAAEELVDAVSRQE